MAQHDETVLIEDAEILFRNFAGKETQYNREGSRNFAVKLPQELAAKMYEDGWNVKVLRQREDDDAEQPYISVEVGYKGRPPRVVMITSRGKTDLGEDEIEMLDWVDIVKVDLIFRPYNWEVSGKSGVKAYLKSIFVTIQEDALELKYGDLPDAQTPAMAEPPFEVQD